MADLLGSDGGADEGFIAVVGGVLLPEIVEGRHGVTLRGDGLAIPDLSPDLMVAMASAWLEPDPYGYGEERLAGFGGAEQPGPYQPAEPVRLPVDRVVALTDRGYREPAVRPFDGRPGSNDRGFQQCWKRLAPPPVLVRAGRAARAAPDGSRRQAHRAGRQGSSHHQHRSSPAKVDPGATT